MMTLKEKISLLLPQFNFKPNSWSLTFGLPHIGLGVISRALTSDGAKLVFDTGLFNALKFPPPSDYIRFNSQKNHRHLLKLFLSHNLNRDYKKHKLVFQESLLNVGLYEVLVREWGKPMSSFSLTCDYIFFKKMYFKKKAFQY